MFLRPDISEVIGDGEAYGAPVAPVFLVACKIGGGGKGLPAATVEQVATVDREGYFLLEEVLTEAQVNVVAGFAVALCDDLA